MKSYYIFVIFIAIFGAIASGMVQHWDALCWAIATAIWVVNCYIAENR